MSKWRLEGRFRSFEMEPLRLPAKQALRTCFAKLNLLLRMSGSDKWLDALTADFFDRIVSEAAVAARLVRSGWNG